MNDFTELDEAHRSLSWWKRLLYVFDLIKIPELDEADGQLSQEYWEAVEYWEARGISAVMRVEIEHAQLRESHIRRIVNRAATDREYADWIDDLLDALNDSHADGAWYLSESTGGNGE